MRGIIDRFEDNFAVIELEGRKMINIGKDKLPIDAKSGDVLIIEGEVIKVDLNETKTRSANNRKLMDELWK